MPVYKDTDRGTWYYVLNFKDDNGKRKQKRKRGFKTKKEATEDLRTLESEIIQGTFIEASLVYFNAYIQEWLRVKQATISNQTASMYKDAIKNHIAQSFGEIPLSKLKPMHIQRFITDLQEKNLADSTIRRTFNIVNACLNYAVKLGDVPKNVASVVDKPKVSRKEMKIWGMEQIRSFLIVSKKDRLFGIFYLAVMTGLRQGELLGLRWSDIHFKDRTLSIYQTLEHSGKRIKEGAKTKSSIRSVSLSPSTMEVLYEHKIQQENERERLGMTYKEHNLVFCTQTGLPLNPRNLLRSFDRLIEKANIPKIRFHDLRHIHASLMISQNEPLKLIAERLGHSKITTTIDTYGHLLPNMQREASDRLDHTIFGTEKK
jgi:integrase